MYTLEEKIQYGVPLTTKELWKILDERDDARVDAALLQKDVARLQEELEDMWLELRGTQAEAGTMTKSRSIRSYVPRRKWTDADIALLRELYPDMTAAECAARFGRSPQSIGIKATRLGIKKSAGFLSRMGHKFSERCMETRFAPGGAPWNKGKRGLKLGSPETWFKTGQRKGRAAEKWCPIGTEKINADGYWVRKINDDQPAHKRWRAIHLITWEAANGPLPPGHLVVFRDGDKNNHDLANLECIPRGENMRRNSIYNYGPEILRLAQLRGALTRQINKRSKKS
ncbi:MAG: HNH endonuclease [Azoarcus sp.]|jgi:hypothetical protein|nr:HNH endonuclease [Azoarcus sp.]